MKLAIRLVIALTLVEIFLRPVIAEQKPYTLQDLQALDRRKAWSELFTHLQDVPPSRRGPAWNQLVKHACLQPYESSDWWDSWKIDACNESLQIAMNSEPQNEKLAWSAAKWAVGVRDWSGAVPFFTHVVQKQGDARCVDPDLISAVGAGLALSPSDKKNGSTIKQSQKLAFTVCWPATRNEVFRRFEHSTSAYFINVCEPLQQKAVLSPEQQMRCEQEADHIKHNTHAPATPLDGTVWDIKAVPDQASDKAGAKSLRGTAEFANGWMTALSHEGFDSTPIQYVPNAQDPHQGTWTARQWSSPKKKAEWSGQVRSEKAMDGVLIITQSDGTKWKYSIEVRRTFSKK